MTSGYTIGYQELDEARYLQLQTSLLRQKGSNLQRELLEALKDNDDFVQFIDESVDTKEGNKIPTFDGPLTESSFKEPTEDQEHTMYQLWRETPPSVACRVSFWAGVTLEHVRSGKITQAAWLAANGGITESGEERIDRALSITGEDADKAVDDCVRTVFRRMSGLPAARGNRSVFVNPTFGRAWWRERIVSRIQERPEQVEERQNLLDIVRRNQQYWENLVTMIVSRGSVFGSTDVQDALINSLARHTAQHPSTPLRNASTLKTALRRLSNIAASREMGAMRFAQIEEIIDDLLERIRQTVGNPAEEELTEV